MYGDWNAVGSAPRVTRDRRDTDADDDGRAGPETRFAIVPRSTLPEEIANRMLRQIKEQELRPGDKLPAERQLAQMMNVSRPVVREALRALALMRVVDIRQGDGTYITSLEPEQLISHLDFVFPKDSVALVQLLEARRVVEAGNVRLAAQRISEADLAELDALVVSLEDAIDDPDGSASSTSRCTSRSAPRRTTSCSSSS